MSNPAPVERLRATTVTDRYGGDSPDWDNAVAETIPHGVWAPIIATETTGAGREGRTIGWRLYYRNSHPDIVATDRLRWDGITYQVDGEPATYRHPITGRPVMELTCYRIEG